MVMPKRKNIDVLLGIFVVAGLVLLGSLVFVLGKERKLFDSSVYIKAQFPNVLGLNVGAQVLLGGVVVGNVSSIQFPEGKTKSLDEHQNLTVHMRVSNQMMPWIRADSVARVDSKGLLGDKNINISLGTPNAPPMNADGMLLSIEPADLNKAFAEAQEILRDVTQGVAGLRKFVDDFLGQGGGQAITDSVKSFSRIISRVEAGPGIAHQLLYDEKSAHEFELMMASLQDTAKSAKGIVGNIDGILSDVRHKKGLIHSLVYDESGGEIIANLGSAVANINRMLVEVESGQGIIHSLIYGKVDTNFIDNLNKASADLATIVAAVKDGQGTLGKLIVDPSVFDDIKVLLGNVKRNELLKSLVRQAISAKEREGQHAK